MQLLHLPQLQNYSRSLPAITKQLKACQLVLGTFSNFDAEQIPSTKLLYPINLRLWPFLYLFCRKNGWAFFKFIWEILKQKFQFIVKLALEPAGLFGACQHRYSVVILQLGQLLKQLICHFSGNIVSRQGTTGQVALTKRMNIWSGFKGGRGGVMLNPKI